MRKALSKTLTGVGAAVVVACAARAAFTLWHGPAPLVAEMNAYWDAAGRLVAGEGFHAGHGFRAFIPPGYAFFLAAWRALGATPLTVRVIHAALGAATTVLVYLYGRSVTPRAAAAAAWTFALWPPSIVFGDFLLTESLFTFLFLAGLVVWRAGENWPRVAAAGVIWGAAALCREIALYFLPFMFLCYLLTRKPKLSLKALVATVIAAVFISPWTVRNWAVLGGFVPVSSKTAVDFYIYNHNNFNQILNNESDLKSESKLFADAKNEFELTVLARRRAVEWALSHPALFLFKGLRTEMNFFGLERDFFQHQLYGYFPPLGIAGTAFAGIVLLIPSAILLPLAFVGALRLRNSPAFAPALFIVILYVLTTFLAYSFTRQRYPLTPVFITAAAATLAGWKDTRAWLAARRWARLATVAYIIFLIAAWALEIYMDAGDYLYAS